ncbi:MAG TPA: hypothetical protein GX391_08375 [Firmicutes bacterium]|jgi:hypothetical protein|nr:hypothetical protein [Bacillota bacterium]HOQ23072.1 hypothetical protein [Bacillota bacterium]HPT66970.1 hypothetical protein [Bacillota bacterium]
MKFIGRLADGLWVSGQTQGFDLYTGWIDLQLENLGFEKQVWVDLTFIQAMLGQETTHRVSIPAVYKETLPNNKERWGCHTPEFPPVLEYPGILNLTRQVTYKPRMIVGGQEIVDLETYILFQYTPELHRQQDYRFPAVSPELVSLPWHNPYQPPAPR